MPWAGARGNIENLLQLWNCRELLQLKTFVVYACINMYKFIVEKVESSKQYQRFEHNMLLHVVKQVPEAMFEVFYNFEIRCC